MKKTLCVLLSLLLLLGMISLAQADEAMTLRLWVRYDDDFSACIADFEALHPGVKIIQEQVGNNYDDLLAKYNTGMQSNDMPNIGVTGQRNGIPQLYDALHLRWQAHEHALQLHHPRLLCQPDHAARAGL